MREGQKNLFTYCESSTHRKFKVKCAQEDLNMSLVLEELVKLFVDGQISVEVEKEIKVKTALKYRK